MALAGASGILSSILFVVCSVGWQHSYLAHLDACVVMQLCFVLRHTRGFPPDLFHSSTPCLAVGAISGSMFMLCLWLEPLNANTAHMTMKVPIPRDIWYMGVRSWMLYSVGLLDASVHCGTYLHQHHMTLGRARAMSLRRSWIKPIVTARGA